MERGSTSTSNERLEGVLAALRCIGDRTPEVEELPGGLTNLNYKVTAGADRYVVRCAAPHGGLLGIDREREYRSSLAAAEAGVGAPVVEYRPDLGVLVLAFLEARTFTEQDLRDARNLERVAQACRRLHSGPRFGNEFDMFVLQREYLSVALERRMRLPPRYLDHAEQVERLRLALGASARATVPCHNDLLAANILDSGDQLWLIDYEYSGNNDPCFELGNVWSEAELEADHLEVLVAAYFGTATRALLARSRLQALMSQYGWTLWAVIQQETATLDFDFWEWGMKKYERAERTFVDGSLDRLLEAVVQQ